MVYMDLIQVVAYESFLMSVFLLAEDEIFSFEARDHIWMTRDDVRKT